MTLKMVLLSVRYSFDQPIDEKIKTWTLHFPINEYSNMEKTLFDWPIVLQYDIKAKYRLISRKFSGMKFFSLEHPLNQPKATFVCIHSINQSNCSISVLLFFLFCLAFSFQGHTKITLTPHNKFVFVPNRLPNLSTRRSEMTCSLPAKIGHIEARMGPTKPSESSVSHFVFF